MLAAGSMNRNWIKHRETVGPSGGPGTSTVNGLISMHDSASAAQPAQGQIELPIEAFYQRRPRDQSATAQHVYYPAHHRQRALHLRESHVDACFRRVVTGVASARGFDLAVAIPGGEGDGEIAGISPYLLSGPGLASEFVSLVFAVV